MAEAESGQPIGATETTRLAGTPARELFAEPELDPNIPAEMDVPVNVAWSRIMREVLFIAKADRTTSGSTYNYRGIDRVVDNVAPCLRKHGVIVMPVKVRAEYTVINTKSGSAMNYCRATVSFAIMGPRGDVLQMPHPETGIMGTMIGEAVGEGFDSGDKSSMKAQSVAYREFLIKALAIPVTRPAADPEHGEQHQIAGPRKPTPAEYAAEVLSETVSLQRLGQIRQEIVGNRATAVTMIDLGNGETIRLIDLVDREGLRKKAGA